MSEPSDTCDAINVLWETVPEQTMKAAVPAVAPKVFDWILDRIGAADYRDLTPAWYRDDIRAKNWSREAVIANAGFPGCCNPETTLRDLAHYNAHWVDQRLRGSLGNTHFNHDIVQIHLVELELARLVVEWVRHWELRL